MFTGIIQEIGKIISLSGVESREFIVEANQILSDLKLGDSVSINGACQTVTEINQSSFKFFTSKETLSTTNLSSLKKGETVNLERPLTLTSMLDGHLVMGHVDDTGKIVSINKSAGSVQFEIAPPSHLMKYIIGKGSIAIDGISLTVYQLSKSTFTVAIIPHSLEQTILQSRQIGDIVNIETDMIAKYVERLIMSTKESKTSKIGVEFLEKYGFIK